MFTLIIWSVFIGAVILGKILHDNPWTAKIGNATQPTVALLLLAFGITLGSDSQLVQTIPSIGMLAIYFGVAGTVGSVIAAALFYYYIRRRSRLKHKQ